MSYKMEIIRLVRKIDSKASERFLKAIYISLREFVNEKGVEKS